MSVPMLLILADKFLLQSLKQTDRSHDETTLADGVEVEV
jgi:hypothetical protein